MIQVQWPQMHNPVRHQRAKHIDVLHRFLREHVARGDFKVKCVPTTEMMADILTKALGNS
jgi:hypothetical protein